MKLLSLIALITIFHTCSKKPVLSDYQLIQAKCDSLKEGDTLKFENREYTFDHSIMLDKSIHFIGDSNTIIKRADQKKYSLKEAATSKSQYLILNSVEGIQSPDRIILALGNNDKSAQGALRQVVSISGDTIFLRNEVGSTVGGQTNYPAGTSLIKNVTFFWLFSWDKYPDASCSFQNITFDGNRDNNNVSNYWAINAGLMFLTKGVTTYKKCTFINSPNENVVGHNAIIDSCVFRNLNGSGYHTSADRDFNPENTIHSVVKNSLFENTNQILTKITGHSEGAITHSNSGGYYTATGNTFINVGESVLGTLYPSVSPQDWGTSNIIFTGNTIDSKGTVMCPAALLVPGTLKNVRIEKNTIINMRLLDWSGVISYWPDIIIKQKTGK